MHLEVHLILCGAVFCSKYCNFSFTFNFRFLKYSPRTRGWGLSAGHHPMSMTHKKKAELNEPLAQFLQPTHQLFLSHYAICLPKKPCITFKPHSFPKFDQSQSKVSESIFEQTFFTCHPFIACILSCHVWCEVFYCKAVVFLVSYIIFFFLNEKDLKLKQFDNQHSCNNYIKHEMQCFITR